MRRGNAARAWAAGLVVAATALAYGNSLQGPFVFDDGPATEGNPTIRSLWPPWAGLFPPAGTSVSGRPIGNLSFAFNYAVSGSHVWSYHALNLAIHILAGLVLLGVVRRTLLRPALAPRFGGQALGFALVVSLLWTLHPLQTEAVTYVVQRVESLMGLCYLLTLYCFIRSAEGPRTLPWQAGAVAACLVGMATKEVMVTAPLLVILYDRTFVAGTFRGAWRQRRGLYVALASTWLLLALEVAGTGWSRDGSAGFTGAVSPASYWLTQAEGVTRYLQLAAWPHPLVFDYGPNLVGGPGDVWFQLVLVAALLALTALAVRLWPAAGFLGLWCLGILAPTCLVPVGTQAIAEHRFYLPLAAVLTALTAAVFTAAGRRGLVVLGAAALALGACTYGRNATYHSALTLWRDTVGRRPDNARAHCSLGQALAAEADGLPQAVTEFEEALRLHPEYSEAHADLGLALARIPGRTDEALSQLQEAVRIRPGMPEWQLSLGLLLCQSGRMIEGIDHLESAVRVSPDAARPHFILANALVQSGQVPEGIAEFETTLRLDPRSAEASNNLGVILCRIGRTAEGIARIQAALRIDPQFAPAHFALGAADLQAGLRVEAAAQYEEVLRLRPNDPAALRMLGLIQSAP